MVNADVEEGPEVRAIADRPESESTWWRPMAWAVVALAVLVRVAWALAVPVEPVSDSWVYDLLARNLARGVGYAFEPGEPTAYWPVGTSAAYAALYRAFGLGHYGAIEALNVLLGALAVGLTMVLARDWFGPRAALWSGLLLAIWPGQVEFTSTLNSELPFNACYLLGVFLATRPRLHPAARSVLAGVAMAAASYVRPLALLLPAVIAWIRLVGPGGGGPPRRWVRVLAEAAGSLIVMLALILPWTLRNARSFEQPALISTNGGANLWMGNNPETDGSYMPLPERVQGLDESRRNEILGQEAKRYILDRPLAFIGRSLIKLVRLHERETIGVSWNAPGLRRAYGPGVLGPLKWVSTLYWWAMLGLGLVGAALTWRSLGLRRWLGQPAVVLWAYFAVVHAVIVVSDRYHYPAVPAIAALAGLASSRLIGAIRRTEPGGRTVSDQLDRRGMAPRSTS